MTKKSFPTQREGHFYLTEGGVETDILYNLGYEMPQFAMFPLLDNAKAMVEIRDMYRRYLDVVAKYKVSALIGGFDYRASPDWAGLLGYSPQALEDVTIQGIETLREWTKEYANEIPEALILGALGPRGDAFEKNLSITENEAEDYHSVQLETLKKADVDLAMAMTFNNIPESIGIARAAEKIGIPLAISLSLDSSSKLNSGPTFAHAVETIERETKGSPEFYHLNCSHPLEFEPAITEGDWINRVRGFRPNAAMMDKMALCKLGHLEDGDPVELGQQMGDVAKRYPHMDIWGGCCGTGEVHLDEMMKNIVGEQRSQAAE